MSCTIVMYHYVRPIESSRWPRIRGLELEDFKSQLDYLKRNYTIVSLPEVVEATQGGELPSNACLLTFDDGYLDHYQHVFPLLFDAKVSGAFFPIGRSIAQRWLAPVNKIHLVLATAALGEIVDDIFDETGERPGQEKVSRFDHSQEIAFIKRILQDPACDLADALFSKHVALDEYSVADAFYMTAEQIKCMAANGMHFGVHGWNHVRFSHMGEIDQAADLDLSIGFLRGLGVLPEKWTMCYPYGARGDWNDTTLMLLFERGCVMGLTTHKDVADPYSNVTYLLPRLDTNDLPHA